MNEGEYMTVWARLRQPQDDQESNFNESNVTISVTDFQRWMRGDRGAVMLTIDDGSWFAVRIENIIEISPAYYESGPDE